MRSTKVVGMMVVVALLAVGVHADTFTTNNPTGTGEHSFSIDFVTVGDAGNPGTSVYYASGTYGAVAYDYRIAKTEMTVGQHWAMEYAVTGNPGAGYGTSDSTVGGAISSLRAMMYVNWLNAGCPTGGAGMIDGGVYNFTSWSTIAPWPVDQQWDNGDGTKNIWRNKDAQYFVATSDEIIKAALYKGGSTDAGYWTYPTCSDTPPTAEGPSSGTNSANYNGAVGAAIEVGSYPNSQSAYGALDMGGNLWEISEVDGDGSSSPYSTLAWCDGFIHGSDWLHGGLGFVVNNYYADGGLRIASVVPEPATMSLLGLGRFSADPS